MIRNPVLEREVKTRVRDWKSPLIVSAYVLALGGVVLLYFSTQTSNLMYGNVFGPEIGLNAFVLLAYLQLFLVSFLIPAISSGAISGEIERQTYDLLWCSKLSARSVVFGKLFASIAYLGLVVFASIPLYAIIFLFGGLEPKAIGLIFLVYVVTGVTFAAASILFSTITRKTTIATVLSYCLVVLLMLGTLVAGSIKTYRALRQPGDPANPWYVPPKVIYLNPVVALNSALPGAEVGRYSVMPLFNMQVRPVLVYHSSGSAPPPPEPKIAPAWQYFAGAYAGGSVVCLLIAVALADPTSRMRRKRRRVQRMNAGESDAGR